MKFVTLTLILFLTTLASFSRAEIMSDNAAFDFCYYYERRSLYSSAQQRCEERIASGRIKLFKNLAFHECIDMYSDRDLMDSSRAIEKCIDRSDEGPIELILTNHFQTCYGYFSKFLDPSHSMDECFRIEKKKILEAFSERDFKTCYDRYLPSKNWESIDICLEKYQKRVMGSRSISLEVVYQNIQIPEGSQIVLKKEIEIPGNETCAAPIDGSRDVKCLVCREKASRNDILYRLPTDGSQISQRIVPIRQTELTQAGKQITFRLENDGTDADNLNTVLCTSKKPFQISHRNELIKILEKNGLGLTIPGPKEK